MEAALTVFLAPVLLAALCLGAWGADAGDLASSHARFEWRRATEWAALREASAVAVDAESGRIAVGDDVGVWLRDEGGPPRRVLTT